MPKFYIKHITNYTYSNLVIDSANQIMLHPIQDEYQFIPSHFLSINTNPKIETRTDFFGNTIGSFMIAEPHKFLSIVSDVEVITYSRLLPEDNQSISLQWEELENIKSDPGFIDFLKFKKFDGTPEIYEMMSAEDYKQDSPFEVTKRLNSYIHDNFKYIKGVTHVKSKLDDAWRLKAGVCQDFTGILLQMLRMYNIPARYVSGYICPNSEGSRGEGATHAWVEAYIPFYGWLGFDPTNNIIANEFHVRLAVGRDYNDCTPVKGVFKGSAEDELFVQVKVSTDKRTIDDFITPSVKEDKTEPGSNSYRKNLELLQQHQQQQQ